ncbi:hypothetical protein EOD41_17520 [Mucilaginibacter limnophilus]|uniref:Uncharacterized protein n=1 Tax=Mucilaginibacter limnophilus TaxID=1932778 RepID=A0A3S2UZZ6_9SPHI|nr:hypothetical protein EOD41_17520 [Mucilaginibacter limnophilus]
MSWIGETFAGIESKKAALSVKKALKVGSKSLLLKNHSGNNGFTTIKSEKVSNGIVLPDVFVQPFILQVCSINTLPLTGTSGDCLKKQILFPHHGFW